MHKVRKHTRFIGTASHRESSNDGFLANLNCIMSTSYPLTEYRNTAILFAPLRMTPSMVATNSETTWSTSSRPARAIMTSEVGFVYFFVRIDDKSVVTV